MKLLLFVSVFLIVSSCGSSDKKEKVVPFDISTLMHQVTVLELIQTSAYTYLKVSENDDVFWIAVSRQQISVGDKYYYEDGLKMTDFKSRELDRTFETIYFIQQISSSPIVKNTKVPQSKSPKGMALEKANSAINIEAVDGGVSIANLYSERNNFGGKIVKVKGQVVKVNLNIMGQNWLHIQDGTQYDGNYDLTITTQQTAKLGDVITVEGNIVLDKDFGAGYFYELIMEEGRLIE